VRSGDTALLFDAGISGSKAESRLAEHGYDIRECRAIVLSHEHHDHICGVGVYSRKFGLPVYANLRTWNATRAKPSIGCMGSPNYFVTGRTFEIGRLKIESILTPHDAVEGVCFVIEDIESGCRFGLLTDLGHVFHELRDAIRTLDAVLLESNYDEEMLESGPYPQHLKMRIAGKRGHISNRDAASLLDSCGSHRLQWVCLGHLSAHNNTPQVALETHHAMGLDRIPLFCADREGSTRLPLISAAKRTQHCV